MNKGSKEYTTLTLRLPKRLVARIDFVVKNDGSNRTAWIRSAISRGLKNWVPPTENTHIWPVCPECGKARHDPLLAHGVDNHG